MKRILKSELDKFYTKEELAINLINNININEFSIIIDPSCGDGQFLGEILIRKMENGSTFDQALSTIYGVDLMQDNVDECRKRLLCGSQNPKHIELEHLIDLG